MTPTPRDLAVLANSANRDVLAVLGAADEAMDEERLAARLAARRDGDDTMVTEGDRDALRLELHHRLLPKLVDAGLVTRTDRGLTLGDHPALTDPRVESVVRRADGLPSNDLFALAGHPRRRTVLAVLGGFDEPIPVDTLAREIVARRDGHDLVDGRDDGETDRLDRLCTSLHHTDLPALDEAGLVDYDHETETVERETDSSLDCLGECARTEARSLVEPP